jgi:hypothetical protein
MGIKMNRIWIEIKRMPTHNTTSDVNSVPDPDPVPDPVLFVSDFKYAHKKVFFSNLFCFLHLHQSSKIKVIKKSLNSRIKVSLNFFAG